MDAGLGGRETGGREGRGKGRGSEMDAAAGQETRGAGRGRRRMRRGEMGRVTGRVWGGRAGLA